MKLERLLIVDDKVESSNFIRLCAVDLKFSADQIRIVADAEDGLREAKEFFPQVVCVSCDIQPVPGTIFVQRLRNDPRHQHTPFLLYSSRLSDGDIYLANELGLENLLRLPFEKEQVTQVLRDIIGREEAIDATEQKLRKIEAAIKSDRMTDALGLVEPNLTKPGKHFVRSHTALANLWYHQRKFDRAEALLKTALKEDPGYSPALHIFARLRSAQGRHQEAIEILKEMIDLAPGNLGTMLNLGATYVDSGNLEEAKETLQELSTLDPDNEEAKGELGKVAYKEGDHDLAKQLMAQTGQGDKMATFFNDIAIVLVSKGEFQKGLDTYQDAIKILSDSSKLHFLLYNMGLAYRKMGDEQAAFRAFCESYTENPEYEKAYIGLVTASKTLKERGDDLDSHLVKAVKAARRQKSDTAA